LKIDSNKTDASFARCKDISPLPNLLTLSLENKYLALERPIDNLAEKK
jgi:hypothetical protein